ncbi:hypothetical protein Tco_1244948 [Tanacetum coccineum]
MHVKVVHKATKQVLFVTFIYAANKPVVRHMLWNDLGVHKNVVHGFPWVLMGDFNVALDMEDYYSGSSTMNSKMIEFKDCVANIKVMDINSTGAYAIFQPYRISDHSPTVLKIRCLISNKPNPSKFFNFLTYKSDFWMWSQILGMLAWKGNLHDRVTKLRFELDEVQKALDTNPKNLILREEEAEYLHAFNKAKLDEERFLKHKSKIEWLDVGDSNSAYFHKSIISRNQRCRVETIRNENNVEYSGPNVAEAFLSHHENFLGNTMTRDNLNIGGLFHNIVSDLVNTNMVRPIMDAEIKAAIKILTNRIIEGVKEVVSVNQSVFILGRSISDNILTIQELMHNYHRKRGTPRCAFKFDIQKAYDTVDWCFLGNILKGFGFHHTMIKWVMACVMTASFSISLNGDIHGFFKGKRGLRQGDPLSLYLFMLVVEILTLMLKRRVTLVIMESLDEFKSTSGLVPSVPKSTTFFGNVPNYVKTAILSIMWFSKESLWVRWIHAHKLKGRSFWAISLNDADMSWGWRKLLQLCNLVRPFIWTNIVNGYKALACYSLQVWSYVHNLADMDAVPPSLNVIVSYLLPFAKIRMAKGVFGKIMLAASSFKNTFMVNRLLEHWKMLINLGSMVADLFLMIEFIFPLDHCMEVLGEDSWSKWKSHLRVHEVLKLDSTWTRSCYHRENLQVSVEFKRISLTGFHNCTSRSRYQSVSKQTTSYLMLTLEGFPFITVNTKEYHSECSGNYHKDNA